MVIKCSTGSAGPVHKPNGPPQLAHRSHSAVSGKVLAAVAEPASSGPWVDAALPSDSESGLPTAASGQQHQDHQHAQLLRPESLLFAAMLAGMAVGSSLGAIPAAWAGYCR